MNSEKENSPPTGHVFGPHFSLTEVAARLLRFKFLIFFCTAAGVAYAMYTIVSQTSFTAEATALVQSSQNDVLQSVSLGGGIGGFNELDDYVEKVMIVLRTSSFFKSAARALLADPEFVDLKWHLQRMQEPLSQSLRDRFMHPLNKKLPTLNLDEDSLAGLLQGITQVSRHARHVMAFSVTTTDSAVSVKVANTVCLAAIAEMRRRFLQDSDDAKAYLEHRIDDIKDDLQNAKESLLRTRAKGGLPPREQTEELAKRIARVRAEIELSQVKIDENTQLIAAAQKNVDDALPAGPPESDADYRRMLRDQVDVLRAKRRLLVSQGMAPDSAEVAAVDRLLAADLAKLKKLGPGAATVAADDDTPETRASRSVVAKRLAAENERLLAVINSDKHLLTELDTIGRGLPKAETEFAEVLKNVETDYIIYAELKRQLFQLDVHRINQQNRLSVLESASLGGIVRKPDKASLLAMGSIIGAVIGLWLAIIFERRDPIVFAQRDIDALNARILGSIPVFRRTRRRRKRKATAPAPIEDLHIDIDGPMAYTLRYIRTRVVHMRSRRASSSLVVTINSCLSGDGKTFVAYNIARSLAASGKRCLLIDGDMFRGVITSSLSVSGSVGLREYAEGKVPIADLPTYALAFRLDLLPSGRLNSDAASAYLSPHLLPLFEAMRARYDFIVVDTPPLIPVPDGAELARHADVAAVVASVGRTRSKELSIALEHLAFASSVHTYVILNRVGAGTVVPRASAYGYYQRESPTPAIDTLQAS